MVSFSKIHSNFLHDFNEASKLFPAHFFSNVPTVLFLVSIFALLYLQFHRHTNSLTRWKTQISNDLIFHWTYFYSSRIWFLFLKICRWVMRYSDRAIEKSSAGEEAYYNKMITHCCIFVLVLSISLVPCLILYVRYLNRREFPNFLMWVAEDPWMRSEIGTSGHYLERPPRVEVYSPHKQNASYRSGRSSSVDTNVYLPKQPSFLRPCKSAISLKKLSDNVVG